MQQVTEKPQESSAVNLQQNDTNVFFSKPITIETLQQSHPQKQT